MKSLATNSGRPRSSGLQILRPKYPILKPNNEFEVRGINFNALLPPATKLGQGNIFRSVCQEFCPQGGGGVRGIRSMSGRYASYWNAFLFQFVSKEISLIWLSINICSRVFLTLMWHIFHFHPCIYSHY